MSVFPKQYRKDNTSSNTKQTNSSALQFKDLRPESSYQSNLDTSITQSPKSVAQKARIEHINNPIQKKENKTGLPDQLKSGIESLSGMDMSDTRVHYNSSKPAQLQAHAYAQGNQIHVAPGQEKHLPHEAWHVVQQKQGRVQPTMQMKGKVNINDDAGLEREADVMGAKALSIGNSSGTSSLKQMKFNSGISFPVQKVNKGPIKTLGGTWTATEYRRAKNGDPGVNDMSVMNGVRMMLTFAPDEPANAEVIGISQAVKSEQKKPLQLPANPFHKNWTGSEGYTIDQYTGNPEYKTNPLYAGKGNQLPTAPLDTGGFHQGLGEHGKRVEKKPGKRVQKSSDWDTAPAKLEDTPVLWKYVNGHPFYGEYERESQLFETTAIAIKGPQAGTYYGSVKWGWSATTGTFTIHNLERGTTAKPSKNFTSAKEAWNNEANFQKLPDHISLPEEHFLKAFKRGKEYVVSAYCRIPKGHKNYLEFVNTVKMKEYGWDTTQIMVKDLESLKEIIEDNRGLEMMYGWSALTTAKQAIDGKIKKHEPLKEVPSYIG